MSSDLLKILRTLKGHSDHRGHNDHHIYYGDHHDKYSAYGHHHEHHGEHSFSGFAGKVVREVSGKLLQNKRLALLAITGLLAAVAISLVCAVWLVVTLVNLSGPFISDIEKNGLKGVVEVLSKIITGIWEGSGR